MQGYQDGNFIRRQVFVEVDSMVMDQVHFPALANFANLFRDTRPSVYGERRR